MEPFDELVEDVYNNASFRGEFSALARLKAAIDLYDQQHPFYGVPLPSPAGKSSKFMGYYAIREAFVYATTLKMIADPPTIRTSKRGIALLFSSVCKGLSAQYNLEIDAARQLALAVLSRYR